MPWFFQTQQLSGFNLLTPKTPTVPPLFTRHTCVEAMHTHTHTHPKSHHINMPCGSTEKFGNRFIKKIPQTHPLQTSTN